MKKILLIMCLLLFNLAGCTDPLNEMDEHVELPTSEIEEDEDIVEPSPEVTDSPAPKISSDFHDAPTAEDIENEVGAEISKVLLQDTLTYEIEYGTYFAVALEEDASKQYRWLLASDDGKFKYIVESHINGYRVFIFESVAIGEEMLLFELTQNTSTLVETLSYQLEFVR